MSMQTGHWPIELDKERNLFFDVPAVTSIEDETGKSFFRYMTEIDVSIKELAMLLQAGLLHEAPRLTRKQTANLIESAPGDGFQEKYMYVQQKVMEAIGLWMHGPEKMAEALHKAKELSMDPTGSSSEPLVTALSALSHGSSSDSSTGKSKSSSRDISSGKSKPIEREAIKQPG